MSQIAANDDYFANHAVAVKWPFTLYHDPIEEAARQSLEELSSSRSEKLKALNLGCGWFGTYPEVKDLAQWSACDLDSRCVDKVRHLYPEVEAFTCEATPALPFQAYDVIIAKEVIEHVLGPEEWVSQLLAALKPGGRLLISTPNYGVSLLPVIEYTLLEIIARRKGFSRFHIHPTKFTHHRLLETLKKVAPPNSSVRVKKISWGMVLFATLELSK